MDGVVLYEKYGQNKAMAETLRRRGVTQSSRDILMEELRKTAGISEAEFRTIRQQATTPQTAVAAMAPTPEPRPARPATETTKKVIAFRDRFPFLKEDDCPDVLKILVADMFTAYGRYKEAHARLAAMPDDADARETARLSEEVVENFIKDREIWEELEYYQEHHELLGKTERVKAIMASEELKGLSEIDLMKKLNSAKTNQSKARKTDDAEKLEQWTRRREVLEKEIEARKKK